MGSVGVLRLYNSLYRQIWECFYCTERKKYLEEYTVCMQPHVEFFIVSQNTPRDGSQCPLEA